MTERAREPGTDGVPGRSPQPPSLSGQRGSASTPDRAELARRLELHPQVAVRPEPFGALAYHYGNRRLVFLRHPDVVTVVESLADHPSLGATLQACGIAEARWPGFVKALAQLERSEIIRAR